MSDQVDGQVPGGSFDALLAASHVNHTDAHGQDIRASAFRPISLEELFKRPTKEFLVAEWFARGDHCMIFGDSATGKSFLGADLVARGALGLPIAGRFECKRPFNSIYLTEEGIKGLTDRFRQACSHYGIEPGTEAFNRILVIEKVPKLFLELANEEGTDALIAALQALRDQREFEIDVIVIDTFADAAVGANENDTRDATVVNAKITRIIREIGCAVILIHHSPKGGEGYRGSAVHKAKCDLMVEVRFKQGVRTIACYKAKDAEPFQTQEFRLRKAGESAIVQWLDTTHTTGGSPGNDRNAWHVELIQLLRTVAGSEAAALTSNQVYQAMQCHPTERTIRERLKLLSMDHESCVRSYQKPVKALDGKANKQTWHYWFEHNEAQE